LTQITYLLMYLMLQSKPSHPLKRMSSGSPTQSAHPLSFPSHSSDLPDALELITSQLSTVSLEAEVSDEGPPPPTPTKKLSPQELEAAYRGAGDALHGLASTSMAGLLDQETVTSELKLPPVPQGHLPYDVIKAVQECQGMPSKELWEATHSSMLDLVPWMEQVLSCSRLIATNSRPNSTPRRRLMNRRMRGRSLGSKLQLFGQSLKLLKVCAPTMLSVMGRRRLLRNGLRRSN